jgi:hypothetical protein
MDDDYEDKQEFTVGFAQLEQLGGKQREGMEGIFSAIQAGEGLANALKRGFNLRIDPEERFKMLCSVYYDKFGGDRSFVLQWPTILSKMNLAKNSKFKLPTGYVINPVGFILGARVINKDNQIDKNRLNMTLSQFQSTLKTEGIIAEDIVRYGRYWITLL